MGKEGLFIAELFPLSSEEYMSDADIGEILGAHFIFPVHVSLIDQKSTTYISTTPRYN
jgi:hypothetical protein